MRCSKDLDFLRRRNLRYFNPDFSGGNRVAKYVMNGQSPFAKHVTYCARDASGNVMAVYKYGDEMNEGTPVLTYRLEERHIYGSARLGMNTSRVEWEFDLEGAETTLTTIAPNQLTDAGSVENFIGNKQYELSNHQCIPSLKNKQIFVRACMK